LLSAWEQALGQTPLARAVVLLAAATGESPDRLARLSMGERDARLLALREAAFGPQLTSVTACPACGERLEMTFGADELRGKGEPRGTDESHSAQPHARDETCALGFAGYDVLFRLPNTLDLAAVAEGADVDAARGVLIERCILSARRGDDEVAFADLPREVLDAIAARMGEADPHGDIRLSLTCTRCAHEWREAFDVGQFLWAELHAWAARTLGEVHKLARAYGWREADILALSPARRQFYLDMIGG
jgi:hypothetical protein